MGLQLPGPSWCRQLRKTIWDLASGLATRLRPVASKQSAITALKAFTSLTRCVVSVWLQLQQSRSQAHEKDRIAQDSQVVSGIT